MMKTLDRVDVEGLYFNKMMTICNKFAGNIMLTSENLKAFI